MIQKKDVFIRVKDQQIYLINQNIKIYSPLIREFLKEVGNDNGPITLDLTTHQLMLLSNYFSARNYEIPINFTVKKPLVSGDLKELLLFEDYFIFKDWPMKEIKDLLEVSLYLGIETLSEILLTIISAEYYVEIKEKALSEFCLKKGINQELSEETKALIKKDFKWAFPGTG